MRSPSNNVVTSGINPLTGFPGGLCCLHGDGGTVSVRVAARRTDVDLHFFSEEKTGLC